MSSKNRNLQFSAAVNEALHQMMSVDPDVFLIGQGVKSPWYVGNTATGLLERFGPERIIDTPVSENAVTGSAVGAAICGMRPIVVHPRMDFMFYAFDPIINEAANWRYMCGGGASVPLVVWGIINRGGEQAAQHSQALHAIFGHIPGLKVVMPSNPYDAKGLMVSAIRDDNPVVFIDDRWLHGIQGHVPEDPYEVPIGAANVRRTGQDVTIVAISHMVQLAEKAAVQLEEIHSISCEIIDMRSIKPLDRDTLLASIKKTGRLIVADVGWRTYGVAAEITALVCEGALTSLKTSPVRLTLPDIPAPASRFLEKSYFPDSGTIVRAVKDMFKE